MFLQNFTDTIWIFRLPVWLRLSLWITEQNAQTKLRVLDIKRDFIEQNKHLLSKWESCECNHMNIMKGKWLILSLFLTCVTPLLGWLLFVMICLLGAVLRKLVCMVCFRRKAFLKSDTVVGLTRSSSLNRCITLVCFMNFYNEYLFLNVALCNFIGCWPGGTLLSHTP